MRVLPILLLLDLLLLGNGAFDTGIRAYRDGRYAEALAAFAVAEQEAGGDASAALLYDLALAALQVGDLTRAEAAAEKAAVRGGAEFAALRDFVRGNVAFARGAGAGAQADTVEAEPFAFDAAIALVQAAAAHWRRAACSRRDDWPQARRNVERALQLVDELQRKKAAAEAKRKRREPDRPKPVPPPVDQRQPKNEEPPVRELSSDEVRRLFDRLAAKEKEKLILRRRLPPPPPTAGTSDW